MGERRKTAGEGEGRKGLDGCQRDRACGAASASLDTGEAQNTRDAPRFLPSSRSPDVCARSPSSCFDAPQFRRALSCQSLKELPPPPGINPKGINTHTHCTLDRTHGDSGIKKRIVGWGKDVDDRRDGFIVRAVFSRCVLDKTRRRPSASGRSRALARPAALTWSAHARTHRRSTTQHPNSLALNAQPDSDTHRILRLPYVIQHIKSLRDHHHRMH